MNNAAAALLEALGRASLHGGVTLLVVWLICRLIPRLPAALRSLLWRIALLRLLIAPFLPVTLNVPILPAPPAAPIMVAEKTVYPSEVPPPAVAFAPASAAPLPAGKMVADDPPAPRFPDVISLLAMSYVLGVAFFAGRIVFGFVRARRLYDDSHRVETDCPLDAAYREMALALNVRAAPELRLCPAIRGPLLLGIGIRAAVLLPVALTQELTADEIRPLLAHELAHAKRRDLLWEAIGSLAQLLFFFHPLPYAARREEKAAREILCDQMALQATREKPAVYGRLLLRVAVPAASRPTLTGAIPLAEQGTLLLRRLQALASPPRRFSPVVVAGLAVPLLFALIPWRPVPAAAQTGMKKAETPTVTKITLTGEVVSPNGKPAVGAKVYALAENGGDPLLASAISDRQGKWRLVCRATAKTLVAADGKDNLTITLAQSSQREYALRLIRPGVHTAVFRDGQGRPIPNLPVYAATFQLNRIHFQPDWLKRLGLPTGEGKTDAQGRVTVTGFPKTEYVGFQTRDLRYSTYQAEYNRIRGENWITYTLFLGGAISGKVIPPPGTSPANIRVEASGNARLGNFMAGGITVTDAVGNYRMERLLPGDYTLEFGQSNANYARQMKRHIVVKAGEETPAVNVMLTPGTLLQGKAHTEKGEPLPNVTITAIASDARDAVVEYQKTDAQGQYRMRVPPGAVKLQIHGAFDTMRERAPTHRVLNVREGETRTEDFLIEGGKRENVSGVLLNAEGKPWVNAEVTPILLSQKIPDIFYLPSGPTDGKGRFRILNPLPVGGKIKLIVRRGDRSGEITITTGGNQTIRVNMTYLPLATVRGRVTDASGRPLAATIESLQRISDSSSLSIGRIKADTRGRFTCTARPEFSYRLTVFKEGEGRAFYPAPEKYFSFPAGKVTNLGDIKLPVANGLFAGRLVNEKGEPVTNAQIWLRGYHTWSVVSPDTTGAFRSKNVVENEKLMATVISQRSLWYFPDLKAGQSGVTLTLKESKKTKLPPP